MKELHWSPVRQRIDHKTVSLAYKCYQRTAPEYLQELISLICFCTTLSRIIAPTPTDSKCCCNPPPPHTHTHTHTPKRKKKRFGSQVFFSSAPKLWNALPQTVRATNSLAAFHRRLKTHQFCGLHIVKKPPPPPVCARAHVSE